MKVAWASRPLSWERLAPAPLSSVDPRFWGPRLFPHNARICGAQLKPADPKTGGPRYPLAKVSGAYIKTNVCATRDGGLEARMKTIVTIIATTILIWLCLVARQSLLPSAARAPVQGPQIQWKHLSSVNGDLPVPGESKEQTGAVVADLDNDGLNDFVLSFRQKAPALVWYRRNARGWSRYVIEKEFLTVEAGGAVYDIDGDEYPDIVFGADYQGDQLWWWRNPGGQYDPDVSWERHIIKRGSAHQHHDQIFGDFKGTGRPQLVFWNRGAKKLFIADIPSHPRQVDEWPMQEIYSGSAGEGPGKYAEGLAAIDIDGDGRIDLLAGNYWFKYEGDGRFRPFKIADSGGRVAAGRFIQGSRYPQVVINSGDGVAPLKWYECRGDPENPNWQTPRVDVWLQMRGQAP